MLNLDFEELHKLSISQPEKVWDELAKEVVWNKPYTQVIDDKEASNPNWFTDGKINMSYNCLDKHVEDGFGDNVALIYESPLIDITQQITYKELLESVELFAGILLEKCGIIKGDRVLFYFPVIPQCLIGILACTRIGAIYSVIYDGFPSGAIAARIRHLEPKIILTCNVGFEPGKIINFKKKIDMAIDESKFTPKYCIVYNRPNTECADMIHERDLDWETEMKSASPSGPVFLESNHPMYIIYSSGTTGDPKGLVITTGDSVVVGKYTMKYLFNIKPQEVWWTFTDFGWLSGQTMLTYGPLLARNITILYEGKPVDTPDPGEIVRIMNRHKVVSFFITPTVMRILRNHCTQSDFQFTYNGLRSVHIGGEISDADLRHWIAVNFRCHVYNGWSQTELGSVATSPALGFKRKNYDNCVPSLGINPCVVNNETGELLPRETVGRVLLKTPTCPTLAHSFYNNHEKYMKTYFSRYPGFYDTMDYGMLMNDGSLDILSRVDNVIQVSSTRLCAGEIEKIILKNKSLVNAAAIPLDDPVNGHVPVVFVKKRNDQNCTDKEIIKNTIDLVNYYIGEFALLEHVFIVNDLPVTKTGKISRHSLAAMINGKEFKVPITVENSHVYREIHDVLIKAGHQATLPFDL